MTGGKSAGGSSDQRDPETDQHSWGPNRRQFLRSVGVGGYAVGVATALELGIGRDEVSVTYALARENPAEPATTDEDPDAGEGASNLVPRTTTVSGEWYDAVELAFRLREELVEQYLDAIIDLFVVPGAVQEGTVSLSATVTDDDAREYVLDRGREVDLGVDVEVVEEFSPEDEDDTDPENARRVAETNGFGIPGGVLCSSGDGYGTLTPAMYDAETGSKWFGTSNHVYGAQGTKSGEHAGEPLYVLDGANSHHEVGAVHRGYPAEDVVRIRPTDGYRPATRIDSAAPLSVAGQFTRYGLALLAARERELAKVGAFSGRTTGTIQGIDGITCYAGQVCKDGQLKWGDREVVTSGDSGSVNYHPDLENPNEGVLVGGINNARTWWPGDFAWGTAAHHLLETRGLHF